MSDTHRTLIGSRRAFLAGAGMTALITKIGRASCRERV